MDKVDSTMSKIAEQRDIASEIAEAISNPLDQNALDEVNTRFLLNLPSLNIL